MMSCGTGRMTKKKIAIFSGMGIVATGLFYFAFATHNFTLAAVTPILLTPVLCLAMCAVMGGVIWFSNKFRKKN